MIKSKETGRSYQLCLQLFCQEEFLRRVALSKYTDNLILKGGMYGKDSLKSIVGFANDNDMNVKWRLFLRKQKLTEPEFSSVLNTMSVFLNPVYEAIVNETEFFGLWDKDSMSWRNA